MLLSIVSHATFVDSSILDQAEEILETATAPSDYLMCSASWPCQWPVLMGQN